MFLSRARVPCLLLGALIGSVLGHGLATAEVLSEDASFEWPVVADGAAAQGSFTAGNAWELILSPGAPPPLVRRGEGAWRGAQFLELRAAATGGHTRTLRQDLGHSYGAGERFMLATRLRSSGSAPGAGGVVLRLRTSAGVLVGQDTVPYADLEARWRQHIVWAENVSQVGDPIRLELELANMGSDPGFAVDVDLVFLERVADPANANLPNSSFEELVPGFAPGDRALDAAAQWSFGSNGASLTTVEDDGGHHGPFYIRSAAKTSGATWTSAILPDLPGSFLDPKSRFELSGAVRYSGVAPENDNQVWISITPPGGSGPTASRNLITRAKVEFWALEDEFQVFRLPGYAPVTHVAANSGDPVTWPEWNMGDNFQIGFAPQFPTNPGSAVEIDDIRLDRITPAEMFESDARILLDPTRPVPTRFTTSLKGSIRRNTNSVYSLYLPVGLRILAAGNDADVADPVVGSRSGNFAGIYQVSEDPVTTTIDGKRHVRWELVPLNLHNNDESVGPIYFETDLPAGARVGIYYETSWDAYQIDDEGVISNWPAGSSPLRDVEVEVLEFPVLREPAHFVSSLHWIKVSDQLFWPGYLDNLRSFGFNAVGGHKSSDGYKLQGQPAPPKVQSFIADARARDFEVFSASSPWNSCSGTDCTIDAVTLLPVADVPCPAFGLVDESPYGSDAAYIAEREQMAAWIQAIAPEYLHMDSEAFEHGAEIALGQDLVHSGCARCNDYKSAKAIPAMSDALVQMSIDRTQDLRDRVLQLGASAVPQMGYYHTAPGSWVYQHVFDLEPMVDAGVVQFGLLPLYSTARLNGPHFRNFMDASVMTGKDFLPILRAADLQFTQHPTDTHDDVIEALGSGARGAVWWPFDYIVGADLYYWGKALESILPVEHLLVGADPVPGVTGSLVGPAPLPESRYRVRATAVRNGNHYFIVVSSYGQSTIPYEDPFWVGDVDVDLQSQVSGTPIRLADLSPAGASVAGSNVVTFHFEPGVEGARTALYHLCDGPCDTDGDGLDDGDERSTHGTDAYGADSDGDGLDDGQEVLGLGTDPLAADSDGDGYDDPVELLAGTDPNDPGEFPGLSQVPLAPWGGLPAVLLVAGVVALGRRRIGRAVQARRGGPSALSSTPRA